MRPKSLAEVADHAASGESFDLCLANFLDEFYAHPTQEALDNSPALLASNFGDIGRVRDDYLAATAEDLARKYNLVLPRWTEDESRTLHPHCFASTLASLRAVRPHESPPAFRSRNLFA